jgi:hypothetical protein
MCHERQEALKRACILDLSEEYGDVPEEKPDWYLKIIIIPIMFIKYKVR